MRITRNTVDWLIHQKSGIASSLVNTKLEYTAELKCYQSLECEELTYMLEEENLTIIALSMDYSGQYLAISCNDHCIRIYDFKKKQIVATLSGHPRSSWTIRWHPTQRGILASACLDSKCIIWDVNEKSRIHEIYVNPPFSFEPATSFLSAQRFAVAMQKSATPQQLISLSEKDAAVASIFAGGGELILVAYRHINAQGTFEKESTIDEYLLEQSDEGKWDVSDPINLTQKALVLNDRGFTTSNCGMFLLVPLARRAKNTWPMYCALSYGPAVDRENLDWDGFLMATPAGTPAEQWEEKDLSQSRMFSTIMQEAIDSEKSGPHLSVDSSIYDEDQSAEGQTMYLIPPKCDIGSGEVKIKLGVLSLDPETIGYILEFINIRDNVTVVSADFCRTNNFILLCTVNNYNIYDDAGNPKECSTIRIIQSSTWRVVYQKVLDTPINVAVWSTVDYSFFCGGIDGKLYVFK